MLYIHPLHRVTFLILITEKLLKLTQTLPSLIQTIAACAEMRKKERRNNLKRKEFHSPNNLHCFLKVFIDIDEISPKLFLYYTTELWFLTSLLPLFLLSLQGMELYMEDKNHTLPQSATKDSKVAVLTVPLFGMVWITKHRYSCDIKQHSLQIWYKLSWYISAENLVINTSLYPHKILSYALLKIGRRNLWRITLLHL